MNHRRTKSPVGSMELRRAARILLPGLNGQNYRTVSDLIALVGKYGSHIDDLRISSDSVAVTIQTASWSLRISLRDALFRATLRNRSLDLIADSFGELGAALERDVLLEREAGSSGNSSQLYELAWAIWNHLLDDFNRAIASGQWHIVGRAGRDMPLEVCPSEMWSEFVVVDWDYGIASSRELTLYDIYVANDGHLQVYRSSAKKAYDCKRWLLNVVMMRSERQYRDVVWREAKLMFASELSYRSYKKIWTETSKLSGKNYHVGGRPTGAKTKRDGRNRAAS